MNLATEMDIVPIIIWKTTKHVERVVLHPDAVDFV